MVNFIDLTKDKKQKIVFDKSGDYVVFIHNLSGKFDFELQAEYINLDIFGIFQGNNQQEFQVETIQRHLSPNSTSNLLIKGVFNDESKFLYQGLIRLEKDAQHSHAYQKNQNIILSPKVFVESKPYLEILANDVFCTHGSTTGKLNKEAIYYVQTRGVNEQNTEKLLIDGFIGEVVDKIKEKVPDFQLAS